MPQIIIDDKFIDTLINNARENPRLRQAFDLRTTEADQSQRMLNALIPGTELPIHRHRETTETVVILRGRMDEIFFDDSGRETSRVRLAHDGGTQALSIPAGAWHTVEVLEPTVIFEAKDGPFVPRSDDDVLKA